MKASPASLLSLALSMHLAAPLLPADWPMWRGPNGNGTSPETGLPRTWSRAENVAWRLPLPGAAGSTPIVVGRRILLTSAAGDDLILLAVSTEGKELWRQQLGRGNRRVRGDEGNSASASPSSDGRHVWAFAGSGDLACFDLDGKEVWRENLQERYGRYRVQFGMTSTPVLHGDSLYLQCIHSRDPYVVALDKLTGKERWKHARKSDATDECEHSYASPMLYAGAERTLLLVHGADYLTAHRLDDGAEVWRCGGLNPRSNYNRTLRFVASPVCVPGMIVIPSAKGGPVHAVRADGEGDITLSHRLWSRGRDTPDVPTPAIHDGLVYLLRENGVLITIDAASGEEVYQRRTHSQRHRASPVVAGGAVYCAAADGRVTVVKAGRDFEVLAENDIGEHLSATPVVAGGRLYLRSYEALYAIEAPREAAGAGGGE
jgi:outer membrane protein assembly factor BamB